MPITFPAGQVIDEFLGVQDSDGAFFTIAGLPTDKVRPFYARVYTNQSQFKRTIGRLQQRPMLKASLNGGYHPITITIGSSEDGSDVTAGDVIELVNQDTGRMVYRGIISDDPVEIEANPGQVLYTLEVDPLVTELGDNPVLGRSPYSLTYSTNTDVAIMVRTLVDQCPHLHWTPVSIPLTGVKRQYVFDRSYTCLQGIEDCTKMAGPFFYYFVDETGLVWFTQANLTKAPTYTIRQGADYTAQKYTAPLTDTKNWVHLIGGTPKGSVNPIEAIYDNSKSGNFGRRALLPALEFGNVTDQATLNAMARTYGTQLDRRFKNIIFTLPAYHEEFNLAQVGGATLQYYEPASIPFNDEFAGIGGLSPTLVIVDVETDGIVQTITVADMPVTVDDTSRANAQNTATAVTNINNTPFGATGSFPALTPMGEGSCGGFSILNYDTEAFTISSATGVDPVGSCAYILDSDDSAQIIVMASVSLSEGSGALTAELVSLPSSAATEPMNIGVPGSASLMAASLVGGSDGTYATRVMLSGATPGTALSGHVSIFVFVYCNCVSQGSSTADPSQDSGDSTVLTDGSSFGNVSFDVTETVETPLPVSEAAPIDRGGLLGHSSALAIALSGNETSASWNWLGSSTYPITKSYVAAPTRITWGDELERGSMAVSFRVSGDIIVGAQLDLSTVSSASALDMDFDLIAFDHDGHKLTGFSDYTLTAPAPTLNLSLGIGEQSGTFGSYFKLTAGVWTITVRATVPSAQLPGWLSEQKFDRSSPISTGPVVYEPVPGEVILLPGHGGDVGDWVSVLLNVLNKNYVLIPEQMMQPPAYVAPPTVNFQGTLTVGKATPTP